MKISEMTFDDVMRIIHRAELLFDEHEKLYALKRGGKLYALKKDGVSCKDASWVITATPSEYQGDHDIIYEIFPGPQVKAYFPFASDMYLEWREENRERHLRNDEIKPECPAGSTHSSNVRWTRVRQVGTTFDKNGRSVDYEAEVPVIHCSHPDCETYYIDQVGSDAIERACIEARKRSELKSS